jgi:hypothetical protein
MVVVPVCMPALLVPVTARDEVFPIRSAPISMPAALAPLVVVVLVPMVAPASMVGVLPPGWGVGVPVRQARMLAVPVLR